MASNRILTWRRAIAQTVAQRMGLCLLLMGSPLSSTAQDAALPLPCGGGGCGEGGPQVFVSSGEAFYTTSGDTGTIEQLTDRVILNWESFNIAEGARVEFRQPRDISVALNRIFDQSPSQILGAIDANGQVYLVNPNGFLFGEGARVNTNSLLASALNITDEVFEETGLLGAIQNNGLASLTAFEDANGEILIEAGAELRTAEGGRIMLFAPKVVNGGRIATPGGQTLIGAASDKVYLQFAESSNVRGLLVELEGDGVAQNFGEIVAERGNITMAGLLLEQQGVLRATTSLDESGSIDLQAKNGVNIFRDATLGNVAAALNGGELTLGENSVTEVLPQVTLGETAAPVAIDAQAQERSRITLLGKTIAVGSGARATATGGEIGVTATTTPGTRFDDQTVNDSALIIAAGAEFDVSGTTNTVLPMSANQVDLELRGNELADTPVQRDGAIRGESVSVDRRIGSGFANVDDAIANLGRTVDERLSVGGSIALRSEGDLRVESGARLDFSGGQIRFQDGFVESSRLIRGAEIIDISEADPNVTYDSVFRGTLKEHPTWGVTEVFPDSTGVQGAQFEVGYVEGKDAGELLVQAPRVDLQGTIEGGVTSGLHQREPAAELGDRPAFNRPYQQLPSAGSVSIRTISNVTVATAEALAQRREEEIGRPVDTSASTALIQAEAFAQSLLGAIAIDTRRDVVIEDGVVLDLAAGGALSINAENIDYAAELRAPSGTVTLSARSIDNADGGNLQLRDSANIDVSGRWVNDFAFRDDPATRPLLLDGGRIELRSAGDLVVEGQVGLAANGGAWLTSEREVIDGVGGAISVIARQPLGRDITVQPPALVSAFALEQGGTFELEAPTIALFRQARPPLPLPLPPSPGRPIISGNDPVPGLPDIESVDVFVPSTLLRDRGFEQLSFVANDQAMVVLANQAIRPRQVNFVLNPAAEQAPSADSLGFAGVANVTLRDAHERRPVSLSLEYASEVEGGSPGGQAGLVLQDGASIELEPLGTLQLHSSASLWLDNVNLIAPAGHIELLTGDPRNTGRIQFEQQLRIGAGSVLDVGGVLLETPNARELRLGEVLPGGEIVADARLGWLIVEGSTEDKAAPLFDLAGAIEQLDVPSATPGGTQTTVVSSRGGRLELRAAEGGVVQGTVLGQPRPIPNDTATRGATVAIAIDTNRRQFDTVANANAPADQRFTQDERVLAVTSTPRAVDFEYGDAVPADLAARLEFDIDMLTRSGVDTLELDAFASEFRSGIGVGQARIRFERSTALELANGITLNAPAISSLAGVNVNLAAPYVSLGNRRINPQGPAGPEAGVADTGVLSVDAELIDLPGATRISGFEQVLLDSDSAVRLSGVLDDFGNESRSLVGSMVTDADVRWLTGSVVVATGSEFDLQVEGDLVIAGGGRDAPVTLGSYGGQLTAAADNITIDTQLAAPGGRIDLSATGVITLGEQAELTTTIADDLVLYGQLQAGLDWIYGLPNGNVRLLESLPRSGIDLRGAELVTAQGSRVDVSGGGDLLAWEFISGPGGTQDFLANSNNRFALLPSADFLVAPVDPSLAPADAFEVGRTVVLDDTPVLAGGSYVLLPARYALLPGAVLVEPVADLVDLLPGEVRRDTDGISIVGGRFAGLAGRLPDSSRTSGFRVMPGSFAALNSEYQLANANSFFAPKVANGSGALPADAGTINLQFETDLDLTGNLVALGDPAFDGQDGALTLIAQNLLVTGDAPLEDMDLTGVAVVASSDLAAFEVGSVVLGGRLSEREDGVQRLEVVAETLRVADGVTLSLPGLALAARNELTIGADVELSTGAASSQRTTVELSEADAVLWLSSERLDLERSRVGSATGQLDIAPSASLVSSGSLVAQGPAGATLAGQLQAPVGDLLVDRLRLAGTQTDLPLTDPVVSGDPTAQVEAPDATLLQAQLSQFGTEELFLGALGELQVFGAVELGGDSSQRLVLNAPTLSTNGRSSLTGQSQQITLSGNGSEFREPPVSNPATDADPLDGLPEDTLEGQPSGRLVLTSEQLFFGDGVLALEGVQRADLTASASTFVVTDSGLQTRGDLQLTTPLVTGADRTSLQLFTQGDLQLLNTSTPVAAGVTAGLGASLQLTGDSVLVDTNITLPSGTVLVSTLGAASEIDSSGALVLGSASRIDVAGTTLTGRSTQIETPGGRIELQAAGDLEQLAGGVLDLSAPQRAGQLQVVTGGAAEINGLLLGTGSELGADFALRATAISGLDTLNAALEAGGFTGRRSYRALTGDLEFSSANSIRASSFEAISDSGAVVLPARLVLQTGGRALLGGLAGVEFSGELVGEDVQLLLESFDPAGQLVLGGQATGSGEVLLALNDAGASERVTIDNSGYSDGFTTAVELVTTVTTTMPQPPETDEPMILEPVVDVLDEAQLFAFANALESSAADELDAARLALGEDVDIRQSLRLISAGSIELAADWDLEALPVDSPGRLIISAADDLRFSADISDGFVIEEPFGNAKLQEDLAGWGLVLVAGGANNAATSFAVGDGLNPADLSFAAGVSVRTSTGDIDLRATGDLLMNEGESALYSAGRSVGLPGFDEGVRFFSFHDIEVPDSGGDIRIDIRGDVLGGSGAQNVTDYTVRLGGELFGGPIPTIAGVAFNRFSNQGVALPAFTQGIASLGGGDIDLRAGGDLRDLTVVAPEWFRHVGDAVGTQQGAQISIEFTRNEFARLGSERFAVTAGGAIDGGFMYVGSGHGEVVADSISPGSDGLGLLLAQSSSELELIIAGDARIAGVIDPYVTTQSLGALPALQSPLERTYYFSYTPTTSTSIATLGDLAIGSGVQDLGARLPQPGTEQRDFVGLNVYPGTLELQSAAGDVRLLPTGNSSRVADLLIYPAPLGGVTIAAAGNVLGPDATRGGTLLISDADPELLPNPANPQENLVAVQDRLDTSLSALSANVHAREPVHINDFEPSVIESIGGEVDAPGLSVVSAEALEVSAASGLSLAAFDAQNVRDTDVSSLVSGGDVVLLANRNPDTGAVSGNSRVIRLAGPGKLELIAGAGVDLGTSTGIETVGDLINPALADEGGDVLVLTGATGEPAYSAFFAEFVAGDDERRANFAETEGVTLADPDSAQAYFDALAETRQRPVVVDTLFEELNAAGLLASQLIAQEAPAADIELAYGRGEAAVEALFPEGRNYSGDLALFFSKIQTLDGGNIDLLVPGGGVNVGLTVGFGAEKSAAELGIVAQGSGNVRVLSDGDIEVNRSRIFTLNGGDISLWSSNGDIDAGRGAKTALATPALTAAVGENDSIQKILPPAVSGSGIAADDGTSGRLPDILLSTPNGVVDAGDAGIRTPGRLFTAALDVVGRDNIDAGSFVGAPADTVVLSADLASVGDSAASATQDLATAVTGGAAADDSVTNSADAALGWLEVFLEGYGPEFCDPSQDKNCTGGS